MDTNTMGAIHAAKIIMAGKPRIETAYGPKGVIGIADLIDRETAAPDMLADLEYIDSAVSLELPELVKLDVGEIITIQITVGALVDIISHIALAKKGA